MYRVVLIWLLVLLYLDMVLDNFGVRRKLAMRRVFSPEVWIIVEEIGLKMALVHRIHRSKILGAEHNH